jgi:hypothetical protein
MASSLAAFIPQKTNLLSLWYGVGWVQATEQRDQLEAEATRLRTTIEEKTKEVRSLAIRQSC